MGLFKRIKSLEEQNINLAREISELKKQVSESRRAEKNIMHLVDEGLKNSHARDKEILKELNSIKEKLPSYEDAVAKGVDDVWNRAVQSIVDFDPFGKAGVEL